MANALAITTNVGCRLNCSYCPQETFVKAYAQKSKVYRMTFETFKTCVGKVPQHLEIYFAGFSEPWLNPECTRMLLHAHEKGHRISVYSTLVGMRPEDIDALEVVPFKTFKIHLPSDDPKSENSLVVDDAYLSTVERLSRSRINVKFVFFGSAPHEKVQKLVEGSRAEGRKPHSRGGNIEHERAPAAKRKYGRIGCRRLHHNILLPNGDVVLCCTDFGMQHVLGNLLESDYDSLFQSAEFKRVAMSHSDDRMDTLCRYCTDGTLRSIDWKAKLCNEIIPKLREVRSPKQLMLGVIRVGRSHLGHHPGK